MTESKPGCSPLALSAGTMALIVFAMFADVLVAPGANVLGSTWTDMFLQFVSWREFGFEELKKGNLALWNPHTYCGAPYFGGVQAALLYPLNLLLLFLPLPAGINWTIAINTWLLGVFMHLWAAHRGLHPLACFLAGVLMMFSGSHFTHLYAGHTVNMASMTWAPLVFLALDGIFDHAWPATGGRAIRRVGGWVLLGMAAVALQVLAGHPQYVFYTAVAAATYALLHLAKAIATAQRDARLWRGCFIAASAVAAVYAGGAALSAIQLLTAVQASGETIRALPVPFEFAAMFGFPPENAITLLNPFFFGDMVSQPYWGRCYLWEMSLFIGVSGLLLAIVGAVDGERHKRRFSLAMIAVLMVLALGVHTPLFRLLYDWAPGFGKFRGVAKFTFQAELFLVMLAAVGFDRLAARRRVSPGLLVGLGMATAAWLIAAGVIWGTSSSDWQGLLRSIHATGETYLAARAIEDPTFVNGARLHAAVAMWIAGLTASIVTGLLYALLTMPRALLLLAAMTALEVATAAWHVRTTFDSGAVVVPGVRDFLAEHPGDFRILNPLNPTSAMSMGAYDLWGSDPGVVRRYAEFAAWTQGRDPSQATQYVDFARLDPLYAMLRLQFSFVPQEDGRIRVDEAPHPMSRLQLVGRYRVETQRDWIFAALRSPSFDPRSEVVLERKPDWEPDGAEGTARVVGEDTDQLTIEADLAKPSILLITDVYTPAWRAVPLPGTVQERYDVQPGNYVLRAIPLSAGHHRFRLEYAPPAFRIGAWISALSLLAYAVALAAFARMASPAGGLPRPDGRR